MVFAPQLRGYRPLRLGNAHPALNSRQTNLAILAFLAFIITTWHWFGAPSHGTSPQRPAFRKQPKNWSVSGKGNLEGVTNFKKPANLSVVALVFYGRPATVSILDCYLKRNLAENGGMLDEVIWLARTNKTRDLMWLDKMVETSPSYRRKNITYHGGDYRTSYDLVQNGTMYIKIDDDIVFIEDTTIPTLVESRLSHPERFIVSANIMNQPSLSWVHQHLGVVRPYLPELKPPDDWNTSRIVNYTDYSFQTSGNWRASELPWWEGPSNFDYTKFFRHRPDGAFPGHRWLPVPYRENADGTPIQETSYDAFSKGLWNWYIAAQEHYSFFEHLENNDLYKYKFPSWDYNYKRMGIQFVAMMGDDINAGKPIDQEDDEFYFSEVMPMKTGRHGIVDGRAIAAHYSFQPQREGIAATDILDRYRAYAQEHICF
ncbi:hypothetical protein E2P81_ATG02252 [Venturia nashicola]|uniref:Uncharacterized protein n=1 Tax=Venturia nashicola TaxID=86259 RepID=A0A4Z1P594_9PEZI|nr:hypothetical protein E6O75_ATG02309 [Venturia nashicola]TLD35949.1 hypothetical protein E2P81_ATG02252 [Venturia nashicola]